MNLKICDLDRAVFEETKKHCPFEEDNPCFNKAFLRHKTCADVLLSGSHHREAYLTYLLSLECLFKDLFTLVRAKLYGPDPARSQAAIIVSSPKELEKKSLGLLKANKFSHDLASLIKVIKDLFPELDKQDPPRFATLVTATDVKLDWILERYQDPDYNRAPWKEKCEKIKKSIEDFVTADLKNIYPGAFHDKN